MENKVGRPPIYNSPEEMQEKVDMYFNGGFRIKTMTTKDGDVINVPMITITGLVLFLGFCDRASFYDYEKREEFSHTIKRARTFIELEYEEMLRIGNVTGAIFALKNFGWKDKTETELYGKDGESLSKGTDDRIREMADELKKLVQSSDDTPTGNEPTSS